MADGKEIQKLEGHQDYIMSVAFSPDGQFIASGSDDKTIRIWNLADGKEIHLENSIFNMKQVLIKILE